MENEVLNNLQKYISELDSKVETGIKKACLAIEADAKKNAPIDDGRLRGSIESKVSKDEGSVFTNLEYAAFVHEGTGVYNSNGRKTPWIYKSKDGKLVKTIGQKPKPFLKDAVDGNIERILNLFKEGF